MYIIIVRESKYIKYISFLVVPRKVFRSLHAGVILYMDLYMLYIYKYMYSCRWLIVGWTTDPRWWKLTGSWRHSYTCDPESPLNDHQWTVNYVYYSISTYTWIYFFLSVVPWTPYVYTLCNTCKWLYKLTTIDHWTFLIRQIAIGWFRGGRGPAWQSPSFCDQNLFF